LISERPAIDEGALIEATHALEGAQRTEEYDQAPGQDVLAMLRAQVAENARIASAAMDQANQQEARAIAAETRAASMATAVDQERRTSAEQIAQIRDAASTAIMAAEQKSAVAEKTAVIAGHLRQTAGVVGGLVSYLIDRAPMLLTLLGAYLLSRDMMASPSAYQLALLGIYGGVAVLPAAWFSLRRG
jgi:hypothetical protein